jgi:transcriptional regulator with XRE-family HTH domain
VPIPEDLNLRAFNAIAARRLGAFLLLRRTELGETIAEVARRARLDRDLITRYETGSAWPSAQRISLLALGYEVTVTQLYIAAGRIEVERSAASSEEVLPA